MCTMERYACALTLCASDKLGDCSVFILYVFIFFFHYFVRSFCFLLTLVFETVFFFCKRLNWFAIWHQYIDCPILARNSFKSFIQTHFIQHKRKTVCRTNVMGRLLIRSLVLDNGMSLQLEQVFVGNGIIVGSEMIVNLQLDGCFSGAQTE